MQEEFEVEGARHAMRREEPFVYGTGDTKWSVKVRCSCGLVIRPGAGPTKGIAERNAHTHFLRHINALLDETRPPEQRARERARAERSVNAEIAAGVGAVVLAIGAIVWLVTSGDGSSGEDILYDDSECLALEGFLKHDDLTNDEVVESKAEFEANC